MCKLRFKLANLTIAWFLNPSNDPFMWPNNYPICVTWRSPCSWNLVTIMLGLKTLVVAWFVNLDNHVVCANMMTTQFVQLDLFKPRLAWFFNFKATWLKKTKRWLAQSFSCVCQVWQLFGYGTFWSLMRWNFGDPWSSNLVFHCNQGVNDYKP